MAKESARGLLIRDETIEALELSSAKGKFEVSGYAWARLPAGVVKTGRVMDAKALGFELKKLMKASGVRAVKGSVVLGLTQSQVFFKVFTIPKFEEKELREAINWHVGSLAPVLPKDAYNSYEVIGKGTRNEVKVLLASAQQLVVDGYLEVMELAGIGVESIEPLAISRARLIDPKMLLGKSVASVHLYGGRLAAAILVNGKLWFSKESIVVGGREEMVAATVAELIKFFTEKKDKDVAGVTEIIYSGDRVGMELLEKNLKGFKVKVVKAESGILLNKSKIVSDVGAVMFAPVLGLAMRGGVHQEGLINLLPGWPKEKAELAGLRKSMGRAMVLAGVVVWLTVIGLGAGWWWLNQRGEKLKGNISRLEKELTEGQEKEFLDWGNQFNQTVRAAGLIEESRLSLAQVLRRLAKLMPKTVKVTSFSYQALTGRWSMAGVANRREDVLVLDRMLKDSDVFTKARLYFSSLESDEGVVFRFSGGENGK